MKSSKILKSLRWLLLAGILISATLAAYWHQIYGGAKAASIHALCPFGALEGLYAMLTTGSFISKIFQGTFILFAITMVLAFIFRRSFCGLLCPLGALQEFIGHLGMKIFKRRYSVPQKLDRLLRYLKYVVLVITIYYAWVTAGLWMAPYDPWSAYAHLFTNSPLDAVKSLWSEAPIGLILLVIILLGSLFYDRFFCKYLCPMGAFYGVVGKASPFKIVRHPDKCIQCGACNGICPVNIDVQHLERIDTAECLDCQLCTLSCPVKGALEPTLLKRKLTPMKVWILVLVLFFGGIGIAEITGVYQMTPDRSAVQPGTTISYEEIKGYMTIDEAAKATHTELKVFYERMAIPNDIPPTKLMKDLETLIPEYDFHGMKEKNTQNP